MTDAYLQSEVVYDITRIIYVEGKIKRSNLIHGNS